MPWYGLLSVVFVCYLLASIPALLVCAALTNYFIKPFSEHIGMYRTGFCEDTPINQLLVNNFSDMRPDMLVTCSVFWWLLLAYHLVISIGLGILAAFRATAYVPQVICQCVIDHREKACHEIEEQTGVNIRTR